MKIDYDLVEKVGATHYDTRETECGVTLYTINSYGILVYLFGDSWVKSSIDASSAVKFVKPIPPKPQVRVEYEKVGELGWHVWQYFQAFDNENVDWFFKSTNDKYMHISDWFNVAECIRSGIDLYRRIEKPVDWRDEVKNYLDSVCNEIDDNLSGMTVSSTSWEFLFNPDDDEFLEMCRVALRANGEL